MPDSRTHGSADQGEAVGPYTYVAPAAKVEAGVTLGPGSVVLAPADPSLGTTHIQSGAIIGANATVLPGVAIGLGAEVRPGAVVTRTVPAHAIAEGNPAQITGYRTTDSPADPQREDRRPAQSKVSGVELRNLTSASDIRGSLAAAEASVDVPFAPRRWFVVYGVPSAETRGEHAHRKCHQLLVAVHGHLRVVVDDGREREEYLLNDPTKGLFLPAMTWGIQYAYSPDAVLLVLASDPYDPLDYIRDYREFIEAVGSIRAGSVDGR